MGEDIIVHVAINMPLRTYIKADISWEWQRNTSKLIRESFFHQPNILPPFLLVVPQLIVGFWLAMQRFLDLGGQNLQLSSLGWRLAHP